MFQALGKLTIAYLACEVAGLVFPTFAAYIHPELHGTVAMLSIFVIGVLGGMWVRSAK